MNLKRSLFTLFAMLACSGLNADYTPYINEDFELLNGFLPDTFEHLHHGSPLTTRLVMLEDGFYGHALMEGISSDIVGKYGIEFRPLDSDPHLSLVDRSKPPLNRKLLANSGAAILQADFYIPESLDMHPTMAILADTGSDKGGKTYQFYRFGIDRDRVFFSFTNDQSSPDIYLRQQIHDFNLKRPGWHRLQMVFLGDEKIICAIDGQPTSFSPVFESSLVSIDPGLMVTRGRGGGFQPVYADNLGVWTTDNFKSMPPVSPWIEDQIANPPVNYLNHDEWSVGELEWSTSASDAWKLANEEDKTIFALFHDNDVESNDRIIREFESGIAVIEISKSIPLRVDVGTPSGKAFADSFRLVKFPTVVLIGKNGKMINQVQIGEKSGSEIMKELMTDSIPSN